jgi:hypothetical protein
LLLLDIINANPRAVFLHHPNTKGPVLVFEPQQRRLVPYIPGMALSCPTGKAVLVVLEETPAGPGDEFTVEVGRQPVVVRAPSYETISDDD